MTLLPHAQEYAYNSPYGQRMVDNNVSMTDQARYTDHEYDEESGFNTMKGPAFALDCVGASARQAIPTPGLRQVQSTGSSTRLELVGAPYDESV